MIKTPWLWAIIIAFSYQIIKGVLTAAVIPWTGMFAAWLVILTYRVWELEKEYRKG